MTVKWEKFGNKQKTQEIKEDILQTFINCPTKLAYTTQNFAEKYKANEVHVRRLLTELAEEKKLHIIKVNSNQFYYCLRTWGSKQTCYRRIEKHFTKAVDVRFNNDIDPSIMSWHRVKNG
jgi:hypothetical protein